MYQIFQLSVWFSKCVVSHVPYICYLFFHIKLCTRAIHKIPCNDYCTDLDNTNLFLVFVLFRQMTTMMMMMIMSTRPPTPELNPFVNWSPSDSFMNSWPTIHVFPLYIFFFMKHKTKTCIFSIVIILFCKVDIARSIFIIIEYVKSFNIYFIAYVCKIQWSLKYFLPATFHFRSK